MNETVRRSSGISRALIGLTAFLILATSAVQAQVFPPRQPHPVPMPPQAGQGQGQPGVPPAQSAPVPQAGNAPGSLTKTIPFVALLGDPTKSFIQIGNMRSPVDTNFLLGRGLAGRIAIEKYTHEAGNGSPVFVHLNGLSNPPVVSTEGPELRLKFVIPTLIFKTYYRDYTGEGDSKLGDVMAEKVTVDVYFTPTIDQRKLPTFQAARVVFAGEVKEPEKCTYFFDIIFPVNVCNLAKEYIKAIKPAVETGIRESLQHPQSRVGFEQQVFQFVRAELLAQARINPASPAQVQIVDASFRGMDYTAQYLPHP